MAVDPTVTPVVPPEALFAVDGSDGSKSLEMTLGAANAEADRLRLANPGITYAVAPVPATETAGEEISEEQAEKDAEKQQADAQAKADTAQKKHDDLAGARDKIAGDLDAAIHEHPVDSAKVTKLQADLDTANDAVWKAEAELVLAQEGLDKAPVVLAFGCDFCEVATFIGEKRDPLAGGPVIPRDVRCPVCGRTMPLREPFGLEEVPSTVPKSATTPPPVLTPAQQAAASVPPRTPAPSTTTSTVTSA